MTMIDPAPFTCPSWCVEGPHTLASHYSESGYVPASGGSPTGVDWQTGATFPAIGVGTTYSPVDGDDAPLVTMHITAGDDIDLSLSLRASEAGQLISLLGKALERASEVSLAGPGA